MPAALRPVLLGPAALAALQTAVAESKGGDPLTPVTVAPPSTYAGLSLRRLLARDGGLVNVRFMVLSRVAELVGAPTLASAGRVPLTPAAHAHALAASLATRPGPFGRAAAHPAALRALVARLTELRQQDEATRASLEQVGGSTAALVALAVDVERRTRGYYDSEDLADAAAVAVRQGASALDDLGHLIVYLPDRLSPAYVGLLGALHGAARLTVITGWTGDVAADRPTGAAVAALGAVMDVAPPDPPAGSGLPVIERIVVAPDADVEVRLVAQQVAARLERGVPLSAMAVLYRAAEPYARLVHEHLVACGLPVAGPGAATLAQSVSGRTVRALLGLAGEQYSRQAVMTVLNGGPIRGSVPLAAWERLSRDANIVRGPDRWEQRLTHLAARLRADASRRASRGEPAQGLVEAAGQADGLRAWVAAAVAQGTVAAAGGWAARARWAGAWLEDVLDVSVLDETETDAHRRVVSTLERLGALDDGAPSGPEEFVAALELELDVPAGRIGAVGDGVFVGPLAAAVGTVFEVVFVVGMAEGDFPPRRADDPLLPDRRRLEAGAELASRADHRDRERRSFLAALAAAPARLLSSPRSDQRSHQPRLPARWCIEAASARAGRSLTAADLIASRPEWPWLDVVPSLTEVLSRSPAGETEVRIGLLRAAVLGGHEPGAAAIDFPALRRGLDAVAARASGGFGRWEGLVGRHPFLAIDPSAPLSPTSLQTWAQCPRRYLFERALRVRETSRPEEVLRLNALDRGTLVHDALEAFFREKAEAGRLGEPWSDADRARLLAIVEERCADVEAQGLTGKPVLWALQRRELFAHLATFLDTDTAHRAGTDLVPLDFEVAFGGPDDEIGSVPFTVGSRTLRFKGRIDRVDATPDRSAVEVIDYKTGAAERFKVLDEDCVDAGRLLQLPVYALAASQLHCDADVTASYWFVTDTGSPHQHKPVPLDESTRDRFAAVIGHIADGIEDGVFPGNPGPDDRESWQNCRYCPYDRVCPTQRDEVWERIALSDGTASYRGLQPDRSDA